MKAAVFSTKRSSHHAFLESLLHGHEYYYENNLRLKNVEGVKCESDKKLKPSVVEGDFNNKEKMHIASFEMGPVPSDMILSDAYLSFYSDFDKFIFLRDPLNTLASTLSVYYSRKERGIKVSPSYVTDNIRRWVVSYEMTLDRKKSFTFIYANKFWSDSNYKNKVASYFGVAPQEISHVSKFANGGSTFFHDKSMSPTTLENRYIDFFEDEVFLDILNQNKEIFLSFLKKENEAEKIEWIKKLPHG